MSSMNISSLYQTIKKLRDPENGCPWDLKQTHKTLKKYLIEECFETIHAIDQEDSSELLDELGDVQLQILLHSIIKEEENIFTLQDVFDNLEKKIVRRHPHVFSEKTSISIKEVKENWKKIKEIENQEQSKRQKIFISKKQMAAPALKAADNIGQFTATKNFDWVTPQDVLEKVEEEVRELKDELKSEVLDQRKVQEELGDLIFSVAQLSRHLGFCPEETLHLSNKKFQSRFNYMVSRNKDEDISSLSKEGKEALWEEAKQLDNKNE